MAEPFADEAYYTENFGSPPARIAERLGKELERASRYVRRECPGIDARIMAEKLEKEVVADIVCEMVTTAASSPAGPGVVSAQQAAGPFQATQRYINPAGDLYLSKKQRRLLGYGGQRAGNIDLIGGR